MRHRPKVTTSNTRHRCRTCPLNRGNLAIRKPSRIDASSATPRLIPVAVRDYKFEPAPVTVHSGDTVEWKNYGGVSHTATEDGGATATVFDSGNIAAATWRYLVQKQGTYH